MGSKLDISELLGEMEKKYPAIHRRFMTSLNKFFKRCNALSNESKHMLVTFIYLHYRVTQQNPTGAYKKAIFFWYFDQFPGSEWHDLYKLFLKLEDIGLTGLYYGVDYTEREAQQKIKKLLACDVPMVNKCGAYKKALESGDPHDLIPLLGNLFESFHHLDLIYVVPGALRSSLKETTQSNAATSDNPFSGSYENLDFIKELPNHPFMKHKSKVGQNLTKKDFTVLLPMMVDFYEKFFLPKEFIPFLRSITAEDYEAFNYAWVNWKSDSQKLLRNIEKKFPAIHKRFMAAFNKFSARYNALSLETRRVLATLTYVNYRRQEGNYSEGERRFMIYAAHLLSTKRDETIDDLLPRYSATILARPIPDDVDGEKIMAEVQKILACEDLAANKCGIYKKARKSGDLHDLMPLLSYFLYV
uniref:Three-Cys-motif partner protein TcmP n=1 Tax=Steinernema glaseri TaxID=37863 RepID=A0A1I7ZC88_9BILA